MASYTDPTTVKHGSSYGIRSQAYLATQNASFNRQYYKLLGWNTSSTASSAAYAPAATITNVQSSLSLYAIWSEGYKLYFYINNPYASAVYRFDNVDDGIGTTMQFLSNGVVQSPYSKFYDLTIYAFNSIYDKGNYITKIGTHAFYSSCTYLNYVDFPVCERIEAGAFYKTVLSRAIFPECSFIGSSAFYNCQELTVVSFPKCNVIHNNAFSVCHNIQIVTFGIQLIYKNIGTDGTTGGEQTWSAMNLRAGNFPSCTGVMESAFRSCYSLNYIYLPRCMVLNSYAFANCSSLSSISLQSCYSIYGSVFAYCTNLYDVSVPRCSNIGSSAFYRCPVKNLCIGISSISFSWAKQWFNSNMLSYPSTIKTLETVDLPRCETVYSSAFLNCSTITKINLPECISIFWRAFYGCSALESAILPNCMTVSSDAFRSCIRLETVSFNAITSIGSLAFADCSSLRYFYVNVTTVPTLANSDVFNNTPIIDSSYFGTYGSIYVPKNNLADYKQANIWSFYADRIVGY